MDQLKTIETDILRAFVRVCEQLNLRYYLLGGTLLGAVRHQGFIPWDDDIDIGMPRADYERFLEQGGGLLPDHLFLQTNVTDPEYPLCFAKIRDSRTTFVESSVGDRKINHGVFLDIFPLDYYPEGVFERATFTLRKKLLCGRIDTVFRIPENRTAKARSKRILGTILMPSLKRAVRNRNRLYRSVKKSSFLANYGGAWGAKEIVPADWYGDGTPVQFEGLTVMAPREYDKWLTQVYGDYMQLPPVEKRVNHHYTDAIDLKKSYLEYPPHKAERKG